MFIVETMTIMSTYAIKRLRAVGGSLYSPVEMVCALIGTPMMTIPWHCSWGYGGCLSWWSCVVQCFCVTLSSTSLQINLCLVLLTLSVSELLPELTTKEFSKVLKNSVRLPVSTPRFLGTDQGQSCCVQPSSHPDIPQQSSSLVLKLHR